jgi:hypothetical protein
MDRRKTRDESRHPRDQEGMVNCTVSASPGPWIGHRFWSYGTDSLRVEIETTR